MCFVINAFTDLECLTWDGYTTFQHCSPLDPDFQTHFFFRWKTFTHLVRLQYSLVGVPHGLQYMSMRNILDTCAR